MTLLHDCDGVPLEAGDILEPFGRPFLEPEARFLVAAPLWRVEPDGQGGWRTQPQTGGSFQVLTTASAGCCRVWPSPVTDICSPTGRRFPSTLR